MGLFVVPAKANITIRGMRLPINSCNTMFHLIARSCELKKLAIKYVELMMANPNPSIVTTNAQMLSLKASSFKVDTRVAKSTVGIRNSV